MFSSSDKLRFIARRDIAAKIGGYLGRVLVTGINPPCEIGDIEFYDF
jgi:hypothetical protein